MEVGCGPCMWGWESAEETGERLEAERCEETARGAEWAERYRCLQLSHTAVLHKVVKGKGKQFVAMRCVDLHPPKRPQGAPKIA